MATGHKGLDDLQVWQMAMELAVDLCKNLLPRLPKEEQYALADQIRRSAQSIHANIAEGYGRFTYQDSAHFCYQARGSLVEVYSHLTFACRMGYLPDASLQQYAAQLRDLSRALNGYIAYLKRSKPSHSTSVRESSSPYPPQPPQGDDFAMDHLSPDSPFPTP